MILVFYRQALGLWGLCGFCYERLEVFQSLAKLFTYRGISIRMMTMYREKETRTIFLLCLEVLLSPLLRVATDWLPFLISRAFALVLGL